MPYRATGTTVLVYRNGRWVIFKRHDSEEAARKHAAALNIHMSEEERQRIRRKKRRMRE